MDLPSLRLKPHEERRLRAGHLWVYSNEIDVARTPLTALEPGSLCRFEDSRGKPLGVGYVNPRTLLCGRLLANAGQAIDQSFFERQLRAALALRTRVYREPFYRWVHAEGDGLPGLVIDRFDDILVVQFTTAGMERLRAPVLAALDAVVQPRGVLLRNDSAVRELEGLESGIEVIGDVPDELVVPEGTSRFRVQMQKGQKTGWFYDQRDNRERLLRYVDGARVLDLYSYVGAWGLRAFERGAASVVAVDASAPALEQLAHNATMNKREIEARQGQVLDVLGELAGERRQFEVVVVDPPALIKRKKDHAAGLEHYQRVNNAALALLAPGGVFVSCSCSFHLSAEDLGRVVLRASRHNHRRLQILEQGSQGPDHPVHPAIEETRYLKALFTRTMVDTER